MKTTQIRIKKNGKVMSASFEQAERLVASGVAEHVTKEPAFATGDVPPVKRGRGRPKGSKNSKPKKED